jgi:uncharacterized membrane protein YhaH (DUF805 family)
MGRLRFFIWWIGGIAGMMLGLAIVVPAIAPLFRNSGMEFPFHWLIILVILAWLYLYVGRVVPARLRDAGWNPLLALLCLVPFVGFVMLILLLIVPSKSVGVIVKTDNAPL